MSVDFNKKDEFIKFLKIIVVVFYKLQSSNKYFYFIIA